MEEEGLNKIRMKIRVRKNTYKNECISRKNSIQEKERWESNASIVEKIQRIMTTFMLEV